ncbi:DUF2642 domain-containing protein [Paenibacillus sp. TH7-28]
MSILRFLLNGPLRRRIRRLQAQLELLTGRVERLEESIAAASFPDPYTQQKLSQSVGQNISIETSNSALRGILISVQSDSLDLSDELGQRVIVPSARITAIRLRKN